MVYLRLRASSLKNCASILQAVWRRAGLPLVRRLTRQQSKRCCTACVEVPAASVISAWGNWRARPRSFAPWVTPQRWPRV